MVSMGKKLSKRMFQEENVYQFVCFTKFGEFQLLNGADSWNLEMELPLIKHKTFH